MNVAGFYLPVEVHAGKVEREMSHVG